MARELSSYAEVMLEGFLALETPEGFRAELIEDETDGDYRQRVTVPFGKQLDLPAPFSFSLETTDFV